MGIYSVEKLMTEARRLAREYREATGKTLPITAEIAVNDAIRLLGMEPAPSGEQGYDATLVYHNETLRVQIKGRVIFDEKSSGYRIGQLKTQQPWDAILLVIMNREFEPDEILLARREDVLESVEKRQNKKGAMSVARFRNISELIWTAANGFEDAGYWSNAV